MKSLIKVITGTGLGYAHNVVDYTVFSGGEINLRLKNNALKVNYIRVEASIADSDGVMALAMTKNALEELYPRVPVELKLGYVPYARQDRVCNAGEALSIKVFCDMINNMDFSKVTILDPHSDVTPALLDRCKIVTVEQILAKYLELDNALHLLPGALTLVAPDAGATKKVDKVATCFGGLEVIQGLKKRDTATGKLSGFDYMGDVKGKKLLIVDDLGDGMGTFIGLAKKLREGGAVSIALYISHGIFSKGIEVVLDNGIDEVYTTNSFNHGITHEGLHTIDWLPLAGD